MSAHDNQPSVRITLADIYEQGQQTAKKVTELEHTVTKLVAINERLDSHKRDIESHRDRLAGVEKAVERINVIIAIVTAAITAAIIKLFTG